MLVFHGLLVLHGYLNILMCFRISFKFGRYFCPSCGNRTLIKVRVEVDSADGSTHCYPLSTRQFSNKGLRVRLEESVPMCVK